MRAVIDTNVLIAALTKPSSYAARVIKAWRTGRFQVVSSKATLREADLVVGAPWLRRLAAPTEIHDILSELKQRSLVVDAPPIGGLRLKDAGDRRLVEAAAAGDASYLITSDREVLALRGFGPTEFLTAGEFLRALSSP